MKKAIKDKIMLIILAITFIIILYYIIMWFNGWFFPTEKISDLSEYEKRELQDVYNIELDENSEISYIEHWLTQPPKVSSYALCINDNSNIKQFTEQNPHLKEICSIKDRRTPLFPNLWKIPSGNLIYCNYDDSKKIILLDADIPAAKPIKILYRKMLYERGLDSIYYDDNFYDTDSDGKSDYEELFFDSTNPYFNEEK